MEKSLYLVNEIYYSFLTYNLPLYRTVNVFPTKR